MKAKKLIIDDDDLMITNCDAITVIIVHCNANAIIVNYCNANAKAVAANAIIATWHRN